MPPKLKTNEARTNEKTIFLVSFQASSDDQVLHHFEGMMQPQSMGHPQMESTSFFSYLKSY